MAKFTKKPKVVDAERWTGNNFKTMQNLVGSDAASLVENGGLVVSIRSVSMFVTQGSYIVKSSADEEPQILSAFKFNLLYSPLKK
tara:strand:+ start:2671 stop:2925 length:255 start_codon:yes stop_codon:yes gene_type:complete